MFVSLLFFTLPTFCLSCRINYAGNGDNNGNTNGYSNGNGYNDGNRYPENGNNLDYNNGGSVYYSGNRNQNNFGNRNAAQGYRSSALRCYSCEGDACNKDMSTWQKIESCGNVVGNSGTGACLKFVFTDRNTNKDVTSRRCVIAEKQGDKLNFKCHTDRGEVKTCDVCNTDYCNSAAGVNFSFVAFAAALLAYLVPKFM